jgi:hypothetical protein
MKKLATKELFSLFDKLGSILLLVTFIVRNNMILCRRSLPTVKPKVPVSEKQELEAASTKVALIKNHTNVQKFAIRKKSFKVSIDIYQKENVITTIMIGMMMATKMILMLTLNNRTMEQTPSINS